LGGDTLIWPVLPDRGHDGFIELDRFAVGQDVNDMFYSAGLQHWGEHADTMAVRTWLFVVGKRLRFRTHNCRTHVGGYLDDAVNSASKILGLGFGLSACFGQMLVTDSVLFEQFAQDRAVELRPARPSNASDIADEIYFVLSEKPEKIGERVPSVADRVKADSFICHAASLGQFAEFFEPASHDPKTKQPRKLT
jgi:hypothetical protein